MQEQRCGDGDCKVTSGTLAPDPYSRKDVTFPRGRSQVNTDRVVALGAVGAGRRFLHDGPFGSLGGLATR
ncbi:hypothetical protein AB0P36_31440 [Streptomyces flavidovirens]|uniref:hypothetical protein n=1 Tax=Streptomyces flavidovirens TaxID=67298 RepID=UPI0034456694